MKNLKTELKGTILHIEIDTAARLGVSKSGKSETVASTGGAITVGGVQLNLNCYAPTAK